tara:strand:+ start:421 stop:783 length:363 start_codon:yes stop_codon:yes gene_type:complete
MASTRNNNTRGNYCLQQRGYSLAQKYDLYKNSQYGHAYSPAIPSIGYTPSHMPRDTLSSNPVEIESALFGINSTNLVTPIPPVKPQLKTVPEIDYFTRTPMIMPKPLVIESDQRPFPIPE